MNHTFCMLLVGLHLLLLPTIVQSQWMQTNGPRGWEISGLVSQESTLYASTLWSGSVFASTDGGSSWSSVSDGLPAGLNGTFMLQSIGGTLFAFHTLGLFRSTNAGHSWLNASIGLSSSHWWSGPSDMTGLGGSIFLAEGGVYESVDNGLSWQGSRPGLPAGGGDCLATIDTFLFTGGSRGVFRTSANGSTWVSKTGGLPDTVATDVAAIGNSIFVLATQKAFGVRQKVYRSTDLGDSWRFAGAGLPDTLHGQLRAIDSILYQWNSSIWDAPFRSTNLGETWAATQDTLDGIWVANGVWYAQRTAKDPRLLRSKNHGATWEPVSDPPIATSIVALAAQSNAVVASTWNDHWDYTSTDRGASWLPMGTDRVNLNVSAFAFCGPYLIAGGTSTDGGIDVSTDVGSTWFRVTPGSEAQIEYLAVDSPFVYASGDGMWVSSDCGLSWKPSNDGLIREINGSDTILQYVGGMAILDSRVFVADYQGPSIYVSEDKGASWKVAGRIDQTSAQVFPLCAQGGMLYAGTYGQGIWRSTDEGKTWQQTVAGLTDTVVNDIISSRSTLFAATQDKGVFSSTDAGESWKPVNEGLLCPHVNRLLAHGENLYAGTVSEGVWRRSLSELTRVGTEEPGSPLAFHLDQNYPNPFNPSTTIQYTVGGIRSQASGVSEVTIVIHDVLGREVVVLVHEKKAPGSYEVQFDASGLSSGLYFCRMQARQTDGGQARDFKHTMKLMHLK